MPNNRDFTTPYPTRVTAWIKLETMDGELIADDVPISHLTVNFALNGVGTATFVIATGFNASNPTQLAAIHDVAGKIDNQVRITAYVQLDGWESPTRKWPAKAFRIWDGVSTGLNFTVNRQTLALTIGSTHWLSLLDMASIAAGNIMKGSCDSFSTQFSLETVNGRAMAANNSMSLLAPKADGKSDMWEDIIKEMLLNITDPARKKISRGPLNWDRTVSQLNACAKFDRSKKKVETELGNKEAVEILTKRFNNAKHIVKGVLKGDFAATFNTADIQQNYLDHAANIIAGRIHSSSVLEKIFGTAQHFLYNIIYNVESATCAPHMPVLSSKYLWRTILPGDYSVIRGSSFTPPELAGVGVYGQEKLGTFGRGPDSPPRPDSQYIIGAFKASDRGKFLMIDAPSYLIPGIQHRGNAAMLNNPNNAVGPAVQNKKGPFANKNVNAAIDSVGCMYARMKYYDAVYQMRQAVVSGRVRFDIAPGSMVCLKGINNKLPQFNDSEVFASVSAVSIVIDAQDGHAITNISLSHVRAKKEDDFAPEGHPFYFDTPWIGSPLIKLFNNDLTPEKS